MESMTYLGIGLGDDFGAWQEHADQAEQDKIDLMSLGSLLYLFDTKWREWVSE